MNQSDIDDLLGDQERCAAFAHLVLHQSMSVAPPIYGKHRDCVAQIVAQNRTRVRALLANRVENTHITVTREAEQSRVLGRKLMQLWCEGWEIMTLAYPVSQVVWISAARYQNLTTLGTNHPGMAKTGRITAEFNLRRVMMYGSNILGERRMRRIFEISKRFSTQRLDYAA